MHAPDPAHALEVRLEVRGAALVARLRGDGGPRQPAALDGQLARLGGSRLPLTVIDVSEVHNVSSVLVGAIAALWRTALRRGLDLCIVDAGDGANRRWSHAAIPVFATVESARSARRAEPRGNGSSPDIDRARRHERRTPATFRLASLSTLIGIEGMRSQRRAGLLGARRTRG
jgi:hypothetical protein